MAKNEKISLGENVSVPVHVGVIMDGNGRWAKKRGLPRKFGHREGAKTFRAITRHAKALGIQYITYYALYRRQNKAQRKSAKENGFR